MEEERSSNPTPDSTETDQELVKLPRDALPAYYSVQIDCFSRLLDLKIEKYESATFHVSGFDWRLVLYPNGNTKDGGEGHISLYLAMDKTDILPLGWEICVTYKMFVFNHHKNKYLTIPDDSVQQIRRFHQEKKESGFDRLISLDTFNAATNGYLVNDSCVFGVKVYEVKYTGIGEALKMIENPEEVTFEWKLFLYSPRKQLYSEEFTGGKHKWRLWLNSNGDGRSKDCLSLYLELVESPSNVKKVLAEYSMVLQKRHIIGHRWETRHLCGCQCEVREEGISGYKWFSTTELTTDVSSRWGFSELHVGSCKLFTLDGKDTISVQAKVNIKAEVTNLS